MEPSRTSNAYVIKADEFKKSVGIPENEALVTITLTRDAENTQLVIIETTKGLPITNVNKLSGGY